MIQTNIINNKGLGAMRKTVANVSAKLTLIIMVFVLAGCAAMQTTLEHKDLNGGSQLSESIMLDAVPKSQQTVHVSIKNTSDQEINIANKVKRAIESHGYRVVSNPNRAHYLLQANILKVAQMSKSASQSALGGGYGSALSGIATGAAIGSFSNSGATTVGAGLAGGLISMAADALVKDINYSMITDVQVSERVNGFVNEKTTANLKNGSSTSTHQSMSKRSKFQRYRTRVVSNADKVNLKFAEARPMLEDSLAKVIGGIF
jgi:hypothetical protein